MKRKEQDPLERLFKQIPAAPLPPDFREVMMEKIRREALRMQKRKERWGLIAVILASVFMLTLATLGFIYLKIPRVEISLPRPDLLPFYIYIGGLTLVLLGMDYLLRRHYQRKQQK
ncbi:hypothetical protein [Parabacteroides sp. Marseille-P3160]|uniref:hypothetical protein n=1 Tax=Parabacteroides sp. Marseille-P3160 TaxID=1917887 RepID=UPI0009B9FC08|nr:hypothetical protein [Parabacteroides sp. Marseille-P3160]